MSSRLSGACPKCRGYLLPRTHPRLRAGSCPRCSSETPHAGWWKKLGLEALKDLDAPHLSLVSLEPSDGDLLLAMLTAKGSGTRRWFRDASSVIFPDETGASWFLNLMEKLGHVRLDRSRQRWKIEDSRWVLDRSKPGWAFAVGARDAYFWNAYSDSEFRCVRSPDPCPRIVRREVGRIEEAPYDLVEELLVRLPPLREHVRRLLPLREDCIELDWALGADLRRKEFNTRPGSVLVGQNNGKREYAVRLEDGIRTVDSGTAAILATGVLPFRKSGSTIALPRRFRPALPYERVLTIAAGRQAFLREQGRTRWLVYEGISPDLWSRLGELLPFRLLPR